MNFFYIPNPDENITLTLNEEIAEVFQSASLMKIINNDIAKQILKSSGKQIEVKVKLLSEPIIIKLEDGTVKYLIDENSLIEIIEVSDPEFSYLIHSSLTPSSLNLPSYNLEDEGSYTVIQGKID